MTAAWLIDKSAIGRLHLAVDADGWAPPPTTAGAPPAPLTAPGAAVRFDLPPYRYPEVDVIGPNARRRTELRAPLAPTVDTLLAMSDVALSGNPPGKATRVRRHPCADTSSQD